MNSSPIADYWQRYLQTLPSEAAGDRPCLAEAFGDTPALADALGYLVLAGIKTATCSALWEWEAEQTPLSTVGSTVMVLNSENRPLCITETTEVRVCAFNEVDAQFAYEEGEDDRTLDAWRREHWQYFSRVLPKIGRAPTLDMPLVCERFRVVYPTYR